MPKYTITIKWPTTFFFVANTLIFEIDHLQPDYAQWVCDALNEKAVRDEMDRRFFENLKEALQNES